MSTTDILLLLLLVCIVAKMLQSEWHHRDLLKLLNDWATMSGEVFPFLRKLTGGDGDD